MPLRPMNRQQTWLLPPSLEELLPEDHPARFVAAFVDSLDSAAWAQLGIGLAGEPLGAPAYHPWALLSVWLYGFMTGVRSCRKLEAACRDQIPYLWLTAWQHPDHNTLWRFYHEHRQAMRQLFKRTVRTAVALGLVDLAVQAVDGTKVPGNAAKDRTYDAAGLQRLLERTERAILELEAQHETGGDPPPPRLPAALQDKERLRQQVQAALERLKEEEQPRVNLTDGEAQLMKSRQGIVAGYNAQAMVSALEAGRAGVAGLLITAAAVVDDPDDHASLVPMLEQAQEMTGQHGALTLADAGFHSGANLVACVERSQPVVMPEAQEKKLKHPYHKDQFLYDTTTDSYLCPQGQRLRFRGVKERGGERRPMRVYRASGAVCRGCPAFGVCTKDRRQGRTLEIGPYEGVLRGHRAWMATEEAKEAYKRRKELVEPVFGILKEQQGGRWFLLRGLLNVGAEWVLLATGFNLRTLWRVWRVWREGRPHESWVLTSTALPQQGTVVA